MTLFEPILRRRSLLVGGLGTLASGPFGCDAPEESTGFWASAQGAEAGHYSLIVGDPHGVVARFDSTVRGHGLAAFGDHVVMFARRPGRVGLVANIATGQVVGRIETPSGRHQAGHGCFSADGSMLFVVEADDATGEGVLAVFDTTRYRRVDGWPTYGIGPHEVVGLPDGRLAVANGGLKTHPGEREPINVDTMRSSLVILDARAGGRQIAEYAVPESKASLRHVASASDGTVVVAMQVQREALEDAEPRSLIAVLEPSGAFEVVSDGIEVGAVMHDYAGSIAVSAANRVAAMTSPRGDIVAFWHLDTKAYLGATRFSDVSGVAARGDEFVLTGSSGQLRIVNARTLEEHPGARHEFPDLLWDNHLITF